MMMMTFAASNSIVSSQYFHSKHYVTSLANLYEFEGIWISFAGYMNIDRLPADTLRCRPSQWKCDNAVIYSVNNNNNNYYFYYYLLFIYCNWVVTRWQWLFYMYTIYEIGYY